MFHCFNLEAISSNFSVSLKSLTKLFGSFWFDRCGIRNACDECGSLSSIITMLVEELFDVYFFLAIAFSIYIPSYKRTITKSFIKEKIQTHADISQRFVTINSL